eukprot:jgi/Botrbrau1/18524/Bobra.0652s0001.1
MTDTEDAADSQVDIEGGGDEDEEAPEWQGYQMPDDWLPLPTFKLKNLPVDATQGRVQELLENHGLQVRFIHLEKGPGKSCTAYVRLVAPQLEQRDDETFPGLEEDVTKVAANAVAQLKAASAPLELDGHKLIIDPSYSQVQLFVGNLMDDWEDDGVFLKEMEAHGELVRCFVMRNSAGESKGYGFVEYAFPSAATKAKSALDALSQSMRPDAQKRQEGKTGEKQERWEQIKLIRSEWTRPTNAIQLFSKVLYISNLKGQTDEDITTVFKDFGVIKDCHMPKTKSTGATKGFAFIEFENSSSTDAAFRALNGIEHEKLGSILVSFANPAKHFEPQQGNAQPKNQQANNQKQTTPLTQKADAVTKNRGNAGRGGRFPAGRGTFAGRQGPMPGRGMAPGRTFPVGRGMMPPAVPMMPPIMDPAVIAMQQQQQLQLQAQMRIMQQTFRSEQLLMQQDLQRRQAIREQELQQELEKTRRALQVQQQQAQQQLKMAETKVKQEAEARRRAEEQAKKAAAAQAALALQAQSANNIVNMGTDYNNMRGMNKGMNKGLLQQGMGGSNYGMASQKSMNEFASNNGSASGPYGSAAFGQSNEHNMYGSATYGSANGNGPYTQNISGGQDAALGMQAYHQMTGRVPQVGYNTGSDSRYGGPANGMGSIATAGGGAIGGADNNVYSGQTAGYAMAQGMNYNSAGYGAQGLDGMYGGGQANTPLAGTKRDADMSAYGQAGFAMDNTGFGMPGMRSDYKRPRY